MRALEKLACGKCAGEGYVHMQDPDEPFDVCGYCLGTGSEKYTYESMQLATLEQQYSELIDMIQHAYNEVEGNDPEHRGNVALDELDALLNSYDPERLADRAE